MTTFRRFSQTFSRNMERAIDAALNTQFLTDTAEYIEDQIRNRTRRGFGVNRSEGQIQRLEPLSRSYVRGRRRLRRRGQLSRSTTPARSNLTLTGEMLNSITSAVDSRRKRILVTFANQQSEDKAGYVSTRRPFFHVSEGDTREITRRWRRRIARQLARISF